MQTDGEFSNTAKLIERMAYMERILERKLGGISLDTNSLSRLANAVAESEDDEAEHAVASSHEETQLAIEDEVCTIVPVEDTTTRSFFSFPFPWRLRRRL
jgi:hypothetical protein